MLKRDPLHIEARARRGFGEGRQARMGLHRTAPHAAFHPRCSRAVRLRSFFFPASIKVMRRRQPSKLRDAFYLKMPQGLDVFLKYSGMVIRFVAPTRIRNLGDTDGLAAFHVYVSYRRRQDIQS
ncbi:hypothetical protein LGR54_07465 [Ancylobacter sp. Lp-2]|uniref:hypothetical protein n=1 Tax=Ancylobacter sp. Lp-2 TaxID=2881339 RepID=UPI001E3BBD18|nr:hypothetical protein [Ancylobacter sp. Lp-2]MCB4768437.1 hypothetical protein [Ancylobacter sp. Lp-2]